MEPANCKFVIFPGAVGFEVVSGMLGMLRVLRVLGVATVLLFDEPCGVVLRLMDSANCELVILPGAVGFGVVSGVLRVLGVVATLLFDERCGVVLRLMESANCELVILPGAVGFEVVLRVLGVVSALLFDERCGVEKSCRVNALEVARAWRCDGNPD